MYVDTCSQSFSLETRLDLSKTSKKLTLANSSDLVDSHTSAIESITETIPDVLLPKIAGAADIFSSSLKLLDAKTHFKSPLDTFIADACNSQILYDISSENSKVKVHIENAQSVLERFDSVFGANEDLSLVKK